MKEFKTSTGNYIAVEVPNDADNIHILGINTPVISCITKLRSPAWYSEVLPKGYELIGTAKEISESEELASKIVKGLSTAQLDGVLYSGTEEECYKFHSSTDSFKSLMQSLDLCDKLKNYVILKKI